MKKKVGVILVGHGSIERYNKELVEYCAEKLRAYYNYVACAFIRINEPLLSDALSNALKEDLDEIVIQPVFLARGAHTDYDVPRMLGLSEGKRTKVVDLGSKKVKIIYGNTIGKDDRVVEALRDRIEEALRLEGASD
jgi:sirohydrochlorin cobaltochelatase